MDMSDLVSRPLKLGREAAARKVVKQFARKFGLVYFGQVNQREDDYEVIRGITVAATHVDSHFCVGQFRNHDISLVERRNTLTHPERADEHYRWVIMQIDLRKEGLPLIFIDAKHHKATFYESLFLRFSNLADASSLFAEGSPLFVRTFKVLAPTDHFQDIESILSQDIMGMLVHHFSQFDYEIGGDRLLIYASNPMVTLHLLSEMLRVGSWLAEQLEKM